MPVRAPRASDLLAVALQRVVSLWLGGALIAVGRCCQACPRMYIWSLWDRTALVPHERPAYCRCGQRTTSLFVGRHHAASPSPWSQRRSSHLGRGHSTQVIWYRVHCVTAVNEMTLTVHTRRRATGRYVTAEHPSQRGIPRRAMRVQQAQRELGSCTLPKGLPSFAVFHEALRWSRAAASCIVNSPRYASGCCCRYDAGCHRGNGRRSCPTVPVQDSGQQSLSRHPT